MTKSTRIHPSLALAGALAGLGLAAAATIAVAEEPAAIDESAVEETAPAALAPPDASASRMEQASYWRARADAARSRVNAAQVELDEANAAVSRMRRNNHPRGDARRDIRDEQQRARSAYDEALHILEVELPAEARAAGAQRRWLASSS